MGKRRLKQAETKTAPEPTRSRWTLWVWLGAAAVVIAGVIGFFLFRGSDGTATGTTAAVRVGSPAPDFTLRLLTGETLSLASLKGKPVLVNFWASNCPHCRQEAPIMVRVYERYRDKGLSVVSINVIWDNANDARQFVETYHLPYSVGLDGGGAIGSAYGVDATPTTFFIDKSGVVRARQDGEGSEAEIAKRIEALLAG
jgi:cytochrome c biogenesis protein CcmG, thiol:disulfide interchange protein DsbE